MSHETMRSAEVSTTTVLIHLWLQLAIAILSENIIFITQSHRTHTSHSNCLHFSSGRSYFQHKHDYKPKPASTHSMILWQQIWRQTERIGTKTKRWHKRADKISRTYSRQLIVCTCWRCEWDCAVERLDVGRSQITAPLSHKSTHTHTRTITT